MYAIYMPGCCLREQNMLKYVRLRERKIKGDKKVYFHNLS